MKVLLITWACDREDSSEPRFAYRWVREISKHHEVTLLAVSRPDRFGCVKKQFPDVEVIEWCDIKVPDFLLRFRAIVKPGYFIFFHKARKFIKQLLQEKHFDIIHHITPLAWRHPSPAYGLGAPLVRGPVEGGLETPSPLKPEVRDYFHPYKFLRKTDGFRLHYDRTLRKSYQQTDCVIFSAPYVSEILKPLSIKRSEIEIEHGLHSVRSSLSPVAVQSDNSVQKIIQLLFVGRVIRTKGVRDAIRAISYMKNKHKISFTIIGDGDDLPHCRNEIEALNLKQRIHCKGWSNRHQVEKAYKNADIFLFPSFREPTGGVLMEAMSFGIPCIVCDYGGPAYMVGDECGIKIAPAAPDTYAKRIAGELDSLIENEELLKKMGENATKYALQKFNWSAKMERLNAIYASLCT